MIPVGTGVDLVRERADLALGGIGAIVILAGEQSAHDRVASVTRPVRELKAFRKVALAPGASEVVRFTLTPAELGFYGLRGRPVIEPGTFDVWIAPSAEAPGVQGSFELLA